MIYEILPHLLTPANLAIIAMVVVVALVVMLLAIMILVNAPRGYRVRKEKNTLEAESRPEG